ncbi:MAG: peptidase M14 [Mediterranea sp.]|jgi:hypothetical protein|nr:peptidase M14 [Mediterranea sp.]
MKTYLLCAALWLLAQVTLYAQPGQPAFPYDIQYYLPKGEYTLDGTIPQPKSVLGFELGQQHVDWNNVLMYMQALDAASDRVSVRTFGQTNQFRPFIQVAITSPDNQRRLEEIRQEHLQLTDTGHSDKLNAEGMPVVVNLMYTIHGNEPSGVNSSLAVAYYLTAARGTAIDQLLANTVIVLTPGLNPDGINRFASWVNSSRTFPDVADLNSREFSEPWPSSRTNHYWADTNRDWLMAQHPEGQNALEMYYYWMPNVVADFHEQGGDRSYYFSPGHPKRTHPLTPQLNQTLTSKLTTYCAHQLDQVGTLYFSKEGYDDYYYGKGAAYGDIHGSVCILYEQLASRGHLRPTRNYGLMSFASTVRNQALSGYGLIEGAAAMRKELLEYQRDYYKQSGKEAAAAAVKGYVFDTRGDRAITYHFLENLQRHHIEVYRLAKSLRMGNHTYQPDEAYVIPTNQKHHAMVRTLMENVTQFEDSTFYDISTWTFPHAYNLQYNELTSVSGLSGERVEKPEFPQGSLTGAPSSVGYLFDNSQFYAPRMAAELLKRNLIVKVCSRPFTLTTAEGDKKMNYGTYLVPVQGQPLTTEAIHSLIGKLSVECGVQSYSTSTALMSDYDLGAGALKPLNAPRVAIITGRGMGVPASGEAWMLLSKRFNIAPTLIEYTSLATADLTKYNVIIAAGGQPTGNVSARAAQNLKAWTDNGGTFIAIGAAYRWTNSLKLTDLKTVAAAKSDSIKKGKGEKSADWYQPYDRRNRATGNNVDGVILNCRLDRTHPLAWGYVQDQLPVMRNGSTTFERPKERTNTPLSYLPKPYLSGFISQANLKRMGGAPAVAIQSCGKGRVIVFADDPNYRMYWYGTTRMFMNAVLFGQLL